MSLTDIFIKNRKRPEKPKKYSDYNGLCLYASPAGLKSWRFDYRFQGKRPTLTFGTYPTASLKEARDLLIDAKRDLKAGSNPALKKKCLKEAGPSEALDSFEAVVREWFEVKKTGKKKNYACRIWGRVGKELLPFLAKRPVGEISSPELLEVLRKVESRGTVETVHRCLQYGGQIFRYAIATGRMAHDISMGLKGAQNLLYMGTWPALLTQRTLEGC
ncbi:MAG: Arm DNA-binding domain-containing protein [Deltaproteobacteria bacterium]|nr:Arm DNA-binding domain-containing protein [Deltaproteobacteria bacterium]